MHNLCINLFFKPVTIVSKKGLWPQKGPLENTDSTSVNHSCPIFQDEIMVEIKYIGFMLKCKIIIGLCHANL